MGTGADRQIVPQGAVKICGIREPQHAVAALYAGADMLGFVFAPSRRGVTVEEAATCIDAVRGSRAGMVGLFVDAGAEVINRTVREAGLDAVQLHGETTPEQLAAIEVPVIKVLQHTADSAARLPGQTEYPVAYMIDAVVPGLYGGTGVLADWALAASLATNLPLMLAGGLTLDNVAEAISTVRPRAVDVSSGVETGGVKDAAKIEAFIKAAKVAFNAV